MERPSLGALALCALLANAPPAAAELDEAAPAAAAAASPAGQAEADASLALTLQDAIALAMRNNRRLVQGRLSRTVERFALRVARDKFWPNLRIGAVKRFETEEGGWAQGDASATFESNWLLPTGGRLAVVNTASGGAAGYDGAVTLRFAQPLLKGGGIAVNAAWLRIARATERVGALRFERAIGDVARAVVLAYRSLLQARRRVEIGSRSLQRARELLATNQALIRAGRMAELEVVQAQADVAERELTLAGAVNAEDAARLALIDVLDIDSDARIRPTEALAVRDARSVGGDRLGANCAGGAGVAHSETCAGVVRELVALAAANRPEYLQAELRVESAEAGLLIAKNNRLWDLSATFAMDVYGNANSLRRAIAEPVGDVPDNDLRFALSLSVPIGQLSLRQRHLAAQAILEQARADLAELRQAIDIDVRNAVRDVDTRLRQVALAEQARELAKRKLDAERQKLNLGLTSNFRLIRFEDDLVRAQNNALDAVIAYLNALSSLDRDLGTTLQTWGLEVNRVERLGEPP